MSFFNRLSSRNQILALVGFFVLLIALAFLLLIRPQFQRLTDLSRQQTEQESKLKQAKLNLQRLKSIKRQASQIEAKLIKLTRRLPEDAEVPSLLVELQDLSDAADLDFISAKIDTVVDKSGYSEIPLTIKATGTFYSLVDYIYRVENMARKVVINGVSVQSVEKEYPTINIEIKATAYKLNEAGGPAVPPPAGTPAANSKPPAESK